MTQSSKPQGLGPNLERSFGEGAYGTVWALQTEAPLARRIADGIIRLGPGQEIPSLLEGFGVEPAPVIRSVGLDPALFSDAENLISFTLLGRLLSACVMATACPHFGLLIGERANLGSLGLLGGLMQQSSTVGEALHSLVAHFGMHDRGANPGLTLDGAFAILTYTMHEPGMAGADQIYDGAMATSAKIMRALCGTDWDPAEVWLPRRRPTDLHAYRRLFRSPIRFQQERAALVFPAQWLERRVEGADPVCREMLEERASELDSGDVGFGENLRLFLLSRLGKQKWSADDVASFFGMNRRTLNRRLRAEGRQFRTLADAVRLTTAQRLLGKSSMPLGQIAAALDFSDASSFTRAFRRWSGQTPSEWRAQNS